MICSMPALNNGYDGYSHKTELHWVGQVVRFFGRAVGTLLQLWWGGYNWICVLGRHWFWSNLHKTSVRLFSETPQGSCLLGWMISPFLQFVPLGVIQWQLRSLDNLKWRLNRFDRVCLKHNALQSNLRSSLCQKLKCKSCSSPDDAHTNERLPSKKCKESRSAKEWCGIHGQIQFLSIFPDLGDGYSKDEVVVIESLGGGAEAAFEGSWPLVSGVGLEVLWAVDGLGGGKLQNDLSMWWQLHVCQIWMTSCILWKPLELWIDPTSILQDNATNTIPMIIRMTE